MRLPLGFLLEITLGLVFSLWNCHTVLGSEITQEEFTFRLANDEILYLPITKFFKNASTLPYQYTSSSPAVHLSNLTEIRFGTYNQNLTVASILSQDPVQTYFGAITNETKPVIFVFSSKTWSIEEWTESVLNPGPSQDRNMACEAPIYIAGPQTMIIPCAFPVQNKPVTLALYAFNKQFMTQISSIDYGQFLDQRFISKAPKLCTIALDGQSPIIIAYDTDAVYSDGSQRLVFFTLDSGKLSQHNGFTLQTNYETLYFLRQVQNTASIEIGYRDLTTGVVKAQRCDVSENQLNYAVINCQDILGVGDRRLSGTSRIAMDDQRYFEFNSNTNNSASCKRQGSTLTECASTNRAVANMDMMQIKDIQLFSGEALISFKYACNGSVCPNYNRTIGCLTQFKAKGAILDFEQISDNHGIQYISGGPVWTAMVSKGYKYSIYKQATYSTNQTVVMISAADINQGGEVVFLNQYMPDVDPTTTASLLSIAATVVRVSDLRVEYGFVSNIPDFAGYIDWWSTSSFNKDYIYGNDLTLKVDSDSGFRYNLNHTQNYSYNFNLPLNTSTELFFADKYQGVVKISQEAGNELICPFKCTSVSQADLSLNCLIRTSPNGSCYSCFQAQIRKLVYVTQSQTVQGIFAPLMMKASTALLFFPDDKPVAFREFTGEFADIIYYNLNYDGYLAISCIQNSSVTIMKLSNNDMTSIAPFFTITTNSVNLPTGYFCPTTLDVCPDNPSILDILSRCSDDIRVYKFSKPEKRDNYLLYDINTLNHPYIIPGSKVTFCTMGNELIVTSTNKDQVRVFGKATNPEGTLSFHNFVPTDFKIDHIDDVRCANSIRGFTIYGRTKVPEGEPDSYIFANVYGGVYGSTNKRYSKVVRTYVNDPLNSFAISKSELMTIYSKGSNGFVFSVTNLKGPNLQLMFFNNALYDGQMTMTIDRSEYGLPQLAKNFSLNLQPSKNTTEVIGYRNNTLMIANYSLDEMFRFRGHVMSASIVKNGSQVPGISLSSRLEMSYSSIPSPAGSTGNAKFNRLYSLESRRLLALSNDSSNSYLYFYSDYYTPESTSFTIPDALCQNFDVSVSSQYYFIVLKCNNYNVFSMYYCLIAKDLSVAKSTMFKKLVTDEVITVGIGRAGADDFLVAANLVTGLTLTRVRIAYVKEAGFQLNSDLVTTFQPSTYIHFVQVQNSCIFFYGSSNSFNPESYLIKDLSTIDPQQVFQPFDFKIQGCRMNIERIICNYTSPYIYCGVIHTGQLLTFTKVGVGFKGPNNNTPYVTNYTSKALENHPEWRPMNLELSSKYMALEVQSINKDQIPKIILYNLNTSYYVWYSISLVDSAVTNLDVLSFILADIKGVPTVVVANRKPGANSLTYYVSKPMIMSVTKLFKQDELQDIALVIGGGRDSLLNTSIPLSSLLTAYEKTKLPASLYVYIGVAIGCILFAVCAIVTIHKLNKPPATGLEEDEISMLNKSITN